MEHYGGVAAGGTDAFYGGADFGNADDYRDFVVHG
jgi:hypothetical protein